MRGKQSSKNFIRKAVKKGMVCLKEREPDFGQLLPDDLQVSDLMNPPLVISYFIEARFSPEQVLDHFNLGQTEAINLGFVVEGDPNSKRVKKKYRRMAELFCYHLKSEQRKFLKSDSSLFFREQVNDVYKPQSRFEPEVPEIPAIPFLPKVFPYLPTILTRLLFWSF